MDILAHPVSAHYSDGAYLYTRCTLGRDHCTMVVCMTETSLGAVLVSWMHRLRLTPTVLADLAGVTRRTVYNIRDDEGKASVETLFKVARGLSTTSDGRIDELIYADVYPSLLEAGGYPRELAQVVRVDLEDELMRRVRDREKVRQLMEYLDDYTSMPLDKRDALDQVLRLKSQDPR